MVEAAFDALRLLLTPYYFAMLCLGVVMGLVLGVLPGLSGTVGVALLIPFIFGMDVYTAMAIIVGILSVTSTSDTIPAVLISVPGTSSTAATILDGYPMAQKGEAARAFGAAFTANMVGGLFGALLLTLSLPVAQPLVLTLGSPEFFMLCLLGVTMVGVLTGNRPLAGLTAGALGLLVSTIGGGGTGFQTMRYSFGQAYLFDGIPLVVMALGIFGLPEVFDLLVKGTTVADISYLKGRGYWTGLFTGARDVFRHWFITLRCSALGVFIGFIPGLGGSVANWLAYAHVAQTSKNQSSFGKGDVRGVIAAEAATNAKDGGAYIPTLLFGIPGSTSMAVLLTAFIILGIQPGRDMLTKNLDVTFVFIWGMAIANVLATGACFVLAGALARLTFVRVHYWVPFVIILVLLGAYQSTRHWGDLIALLSVGFLGWVMKRFGWPRAPLLVGFVLGKLGETYLYRSIGNYGAAWLTRPGVITIAVLIAVSVVLAVRWQIKRARSQT